MKQSKKLRILFVTNNYTPYSAGVVSSINAATEALSLAGHEVFIAAPDFLSKKAPNRPQDPPYVFRITCPIHFTYKEKHIAIPFFPQKELSAIISELKPDIIHTHHPFLLGKAALAVARKLSIPIVFTYHTLYEYYAHYFHCPQKIAQWFAKRYATQYCNAVDAVIVPSTAVKEHIIKQGVSTPTTVIPSALQSFFIHENRPCKQKHRLELFRLLLVSRMVKEKNILFALEAFKLLPNDFKLIVIGNGDEYKNIVSYAYDRLRLPRASVLFIKESKGLELVEFYKGSDLFLFPSTTDTQGIVLAESMACGTPVVSVDGPGQRDIIRNGMNGFLVKTPQEMAEVIMQIRQDKDLHMLLQEYAWRTSRFYMPQVMGDRLTEFYGTVL